jgi:hypothetical protein
MRTVHKPLTADFSGPMPIGVPSAARETWMGFLQDLWGFMRVRKKYWLLPLITALLLFGFMIVFTSGTAIAPFIYTLF